MDTLTVCSLPLKRGSRRQKSFFVLIGFPLCSISTEHHRMQKGLYHPVSDGLEVILLFLGLEVETCRAISYILSNWNAGSHNLSMDQGVFKKCVFFALSVYAVKAPGGNNIVQKPKGSQQCLVLIFVDCFLFLILFFIFTAVHFLFYFM